MLHGGHVVGRDVYGGQDGGGGGSHSISWEGGVEVSMMGWEDGSLLGGGEGVRGRIVLAFLFSRLES